MRGIFTSHKQPPPTLSIFKCNHEMSAMHTSMRATGYQHTHIYEIQKNRATCTKKKSAPQLELELELDSAIEREIS